MLDVSRQDFTDSVLALLICSDCLVVKGNLINSKRHYSFLRACRLSFICFICLFGFRQWSVVLFEHCYPKSILCTPTILHPNESPQSSAHNSCLISRLFLPRKISKHGQLLLISHNMTNQKSNYNICQN